MQRSQIIITAIGVLRSIHSILTWQYRSLLDNQRFILTTSRIEQQAMKNFSGIKATIRFSNNGLLTLCIVSLSLSKYQSHQKSQIINQVRQ